MNLAQIYDRLSGEPKKRNGGAARGEMEELSAEAETKKIISPTTNRDAPVFPHRENNIFDLISELFISGNECLILLCALDLTVSCENERLQI